MIFTKVSGDTNPSYCASCPVAKVVPLLAAWERSSLKLSISFTKASSDPLTE